MTRENERADVVGMVLNVLLGPFLFLILRLIITYLLFPFSKDLFFSNFFPTLWGPSLPPPLIAWFSLFFFDFERFFLPSCWKMFLIGEFGFQQTEEFCKKEGKKTKKKYITGIETLKDGLIASFHSAPNSHNITVQMLRKRRWSSSSTGRGSSTCSSSVEEYPNPKLVTVSSKSRKSSQVWWMTDELRGLKRESIQVWKCSSFVSFFFCGGTAMTTSYATHVIASIAHSPALSLYDVLQLRVPPLPPFATTAMNASYCQLL